jgi:hypothetical protein
VAVNQKPEQVAGLAAGPGPLGILKNARVNLVLAHLGRIVP